MKHTEEPWRLGRFTGANYAEVRETAGGMDIVVDTVHGPYVLASCNKNFLVDAHENARRIVACVNACKGIKTESLEMEVLSWITDETGENPLQRERDVMPVLR